MRSARVVLLGIVTILAACGGNSMSSVASEAASTAKSTSPIFPRGTALIQTDVGSVRLSVEVAKTDEQRAFGLMFRRKLAADGGMVFLFDTDTNAGFWMKNTLIPLSIAFYDAGGKIVRILDMTPCKTDPCPVYDPEVGYRGALEVNRGAFRRWGVEEGDRILVKVAVA